MLSIQWIANYQIKSKVMHTINHIRHSDTEITAMSINFHNLCELNKFLHNHSTINDMFSLVFFFILNGCCYCCRFGAICAHFVRPPAISLNSYPINFGYLACSIPINQTKFTAIRAICKADFK